MLLLLLLLLRLLAGRLRMMKPVEVLDCHRSAERSDPTEVIVHSDELLEVVHRHALIIDCLGDFLLPQGSTSRLIRGRTIGRFQLRESPSFSRDDVTQPVWVVVRIFVADVQLLPLPSPLPLRC